MLGTVFRSMCGKEVEGTEHFSPVLAKPVWENGHRIKGMKNTHRRGRRDGEHGKVFLCFLGFHEGSRLSMSG